MPPTKAAMPVPDSRSLTLTDSFKTAIALVDRAQSVKVIVSAQEYEMARTDYKTLIDYEKQLQEQYDQHPAVVAAREVQAQKKDLAAKFDAAKKFLKNGPMLKFEQVEEEKRQAQERKLAAEAKAKADAETAARVAEQKKAWEAAEKERKAAEAKAAKARSESARVAAEQAAKDAAARAAAAVVEAQAIKEEAKAAPVPVVVVDKTAPEVRRSKVYRWRLTAKDGRRFSNDDFKKVLRLRPDELKDGTPLRCFVLDHTAVSAIVDSLGDNHGFPGLEVWSELV